MSFFTELKRRNVFRLALLYLETDPRWQELMSAVGIADGTAERVGL